MFITFVLEPDVFTQSYVMSCNLKSSEHRGPALTFARTLDVAYSSRFASQSNHTFTLADRPLKYNFLMVTLKKNGLSLKKGYATREPLFIKQPG